MAPVLCLTKRQLCDLECLLNGSFAPLKGFLGEDDYHAVCQTMRLVNGTLWPMPITLDVSQAFAEQVPLGTSITLTNEDNTPLAELTVHSKWQPDKEAEALLVFGSLDHKHPGVDYLFNVAGPYYLGGELRALSPIQHYDFAAYRHTPHELKQLFHLLGWSKIVAFQTRNPIHRAHYELIQRACSATQAQLLIHPVVGMTRMGDVDAATRIQCYKAILSEFPPHQALLSLLPLAMRMAGPREALWHAIIRKNFGVSHFIIGRDHAGPGVDAAGRPFYDPYAAQTLVQQHQEEIGLVCLTFSAMVYVKEKASFFPVESVDSQDTIVDISGTELRRRLEQGIAIPDWFTFPSVRKILQETYPPKHRQGFTLFFTGLSGSGKSTLAQAVMAYLQNYVSPRKISLLDGDIVRRHLSEGLGFSKADRDTQIRRVGYVAAEITKHGGIAICAAIAPYAEMRQQVRTAIKAYGGFIEIYVATPLSVCKTRDVKGLYRQAELGLIQHFTGISDPYEVPLHPEIMLDTSELTVEACVQKIVSILIEQGYLLQEQEHHFKMKRIPQER